MLKEKSRTNEVKFCIVEIFIICSLVVNIIYLESFLILADYYLSYKESLENNEILIIITFLEGIFTFAYVGIFIKFFIKLNRFYKSIEQD